MLKNHRRSPQCVLLHLLSAVRMNLYAAHLAFKKPQFSLVHHLGILYKSQFCV